MATRTEDILSIFLDGLFKFDGTTQLTVSSRLLDHAQECSKCDGTLARRVESVMLDAQKSVEEAEGAVRQRLRRTYLLLCGWIYMALSREEPFCQYQIVLVCRAAGNRVQAGKKRRYGRIFVTAVRW